MANAATTSTASAAQTTSRVQLALNVSDLEASVAFYSAHVRGRAAKRRPGLRQLRRRRAAAQARPHRDHATTSAAPERSARSTTSVSRSPSVEGVTAARERLRRSRAWPPSTRTTPPAATRCRTRCGSTTRPALRGRSTPSRTTTPPTLARPRLRSSSSVRLAAARTPEPGVACCSTERVSATDHADRPTDDGRRPASRRSTASCPFWIGIAMVAGLLLGRVVPGLGEAPRRGRGRRGQRCPSRSACS